MHWQYLIGADIVKNCCTEPWHHVRINESQIKQKRNPQSFISPALCEGNPPATGRFPTQRFTNIENILMSWNHHVQMIPCHFEDVPCESALLWHNDIQWEWILGIGHSHGLRVIRWSIFMFDGLIKVIIVINHTVTWNKPICDQWILHKKGSVMWKSFPCYYIILLPCIAIM